MCSSAPFLPLRLCTRPAQLQVLSDSDPITAHGEGRVRKKPKDGDQNLRFGLMPHAFEGRLLLRKRFIIISIFLEALSLGVA